MATLFEAFATVVGNPKNMSNGSTIKDPPAETMLIVPAKIPTKNTINNVMISKSSPPIIFNNIGKLIICKKDEPQISNVLL
ncbi:hypothetical protein GCM10007366_23280 [Mammaliicoccus vitulinus]|nr:hypothetical protein GCM10007366_23280 [Mammaliicoccus vitulinus]